jgi:hypothetical protein
MTPAIGPETPLGAPEPPSGGCSGSHGAATPEEPRPDWVDAVEITETIHADAMLAVGVHPIGAVRQAAAALLSGQAVLLETSFRPEPLLETMRQADYRVWCGRLEPGRHSTYITLA